VLDVFGGGGSSYSRKARTRSTIADIYRWLQILLESGVEDKVERVLVDSDGYDLDDYGDQFGLMEAQWSSFAYGARLQAPGPISQPFAGCS
jgi:hypothetical protein